MLVELCAGNHVTSDDGIFKDFTTTPESLEWIDFGLPHIGVQIRLQHLHVYQEHPNIQNH
jgi:hypothetical protein